MRTEVAARPQRDVEEKQRLEERASSLELELAARMSEHATLAAHADKSAAALQKVNEEREELEGEVEQLRREIEAIRRIEPERDRLAREVEELMRERDALRQGVAMTVRLASDAKHGPAPKPSAGSDVPPIPYWVIVLVLVTFLVSIVGAIQC